MLIYILSRCDEHYTIDNISKNPKHNMENMLSDNIPWSTIGSPVNAQYIVLINNNKKIIPITKLVVVQKNRQLLELNRKLAKFTNDGGSIMSFNLNKEFSIAHLILDVDLFCRQKTNIATTQVELRDKNYKVVWSSDKPMFINTRYIYLDMVKANLIYPTMQNVLCNGSGISNQEDKLIDHLKRDVW
jgi:hypothetical protein